jgi:predicted RNA binding protein YcfA (HicA-like mRNA interferase family)
MTSKEVVKKLREAGWTFTSGGRHQIMAVSPDGRIRVPIPDHPGDLKIGTLKKIARETGISLQKRQ